MAYFFFFFFFNDTATTEIYTLSLHDALPICLAPVSWRAMMLRLAHRLFPRGPPCRPPPKKLPARRSRSDRKSTRLNSSHGYISYAVFCLKKKKKKYTVQLLTQRNISEECAVL